MAVRVLVIDDYRDARAALVDLVSHLEGFEVIGQAASEQEGVELLHELRGEVDLVVIDLLIQGGSGFNLIPRSARGDYPAHTVIFSAFVTPVIGDRCVKLGAAAAFNKNDVNGLVNHLERFKSMFVAGRDHRNHGGADGGGQHAA